MDEEYVVYRSKDDGEFFSPKIKNPFLSSEPFQQDDEAIWQLLAQEEIEKIGGAQVKETRGK